jgi:hypothetical protein
VPTATGAARFFATWTAEAAAELRVSAFYGAWPCVRDLSSTRTLKQKVNCIGIGFVKDMQPAYRACGRCEPGQIQKSRQR